MGSPRSRRFVAASRTASVSCLAIGIAVLYGWWVDDIRWMSGLGAPPPTMPDTALCLLLAAASLLVLSRRDPVRLLRLPALLCAAAIFSIGSLTLVEYLTGTSLFVDNLVRVRHSAHVDPPYRMLPATAVCMVLLGIALVPATIRRAHTAIQPLAIALAVLSTMALVGYCFNPGTFAATRLTSLMALPTCVALLLISISLFFLHPGEGLLALALGQGAGAMVARRLLPACIALPVLLGAAATLGERAGLYDEEFRFGIFSVAVIAVFAGIVWWNAVSIQRLDMARLHSESALRISEARFRGLAEANLVGVAFHDCGGTLVYANEAFLKLVGYSGEDVASGSLTLRQVTPEEYRERDAVAIREAATSGACTPYEKKLLRKDGTQVPVLTGFAALDRKDREGVLLAIDLSEQKRLEEKMVQTQKMESIALLAGGIAHDFNNLLVGVLGNASLVLDGMNRDNPDRRLLESVVSAAENAAALTRQLLAYAGKGRFYIEWIDVSRFCAETQALLQSAVHGRIELRFVLGKNLPRVHMDRSQLQQILMNLVLNAAEAMPEGGGGVVTVSTGSEPAAHVSGLQNLTHEEAAPGPYVVLQVQDNGTGIAEDLLPRIFDPFFTTKSVGRGLGLAAVIGIVRSYRGILTVTSAPGQGSRFTVYLPAAGSGGSPAAAPKVRP